MIRNYELKCAQNTMLFLIFVVRLFTLLRDIKHRPAKPFTVAFYSPGYLGCLRSVQYNFVLVWSLHKFNGLNIHDCTRDLMYRTASEQFKLECALRKPKVGIFLGRLFSLSLNAAIRKFTREYPELAKSKTDFPITT